jgi:hypothetical protein
MSHLYFDAESSDYAPSACPKGLASRRTRMGVAYGIANLLNFQGQDPTIEPIFLDLVLDIPPHVLRVLSHLVKNSELKFP